MKLANFFYLLETAEIFGLFRNTYPVIIPDSAVQGLVQACLAAITSDILISEWFLFEELKPRKIGQKQVPAKTFYLMSSDDKKQYFVRHNGRGIRSISHIGFAAICSPNHIRVTVKL